MRRFLHDNGLSLFFLVIFLGTVLGQSIAAHRVYNEEEMAHHGTLISYGRYLTSSSFGQAMLENWQSEFLQFSLYILATVWLVQRGAKDSKEPGEEGFMSDEQQQVGPHAGGRA